MNARVLSGLQRTACPPDDLAVLQNTPALRNVDDADLMAKCDVLRELDLPGCIPFAHSGRAA